MEQVGLKGGYRGFRATGAIMQRLSKVDASVGGGVRTSDEGYL